MRWKIHEMNKEHLEQIMQIEKASFPTPWTNGMFLAELTSPRAYHFVATRQGSQENIVLSYIFFWMFMKEVHILNLATHPDFRKLGIAFSLLLFVLNFAYKRGAVLYLLEVRADNQDAVNLYRKVGFASWGVRKKYYADTNEDGIIMGLFYADRLFDTKKDEQSHLL